MNIFFEMDCGGETVTIEKTDDGDFIFHGWDEETELAAIELGFEPSACLIIWNAINDDALDDALFYRASRGSALIVEALIFAGADVRMRGHYQWTPLHEAAGNGHTDIVKLLLEAGTSVDASDNEGWTPLHYTAAHGYPDVVKILLIAGASVGAKTDSGHTPMSLAVSWEESSIVEILESWIEEHNS